MSPFDIKDCAIASIATGIKAQTLGEFRDRLLMIDPSSLYFHFWQGRLKTFEYREFYNDFSYWAHYSLHDDYLAERLAIVNPVAFESLELLREEILEILENRIDEQETTWVKREEGFHFIRSKIIVFNTRIRLEQPKDLVKVVPQLSHSSIFYHFIDARRRTEQQEDDFSVWLRSFAEHADLIAKLKEIDPYFNSLADVKKKLIAVFTEHFVEQVDQS